MSATLAADAADFIRGHTSLTQAPLVPEFTLHLATEITPIWQATEDWLRARALDPPFWAFAWPGAQALARHMLDHPDTVIGKRVLDFAAGCGLAALAARRAGATLVHAAEIDRLAAAAIRLNATTNCLDVTVIEDDVVGNDGAWDPILCGDVCYEAPMTRHILPWLRRLARTATVWIADPGRAYLPVDRMRTLAEFAVPTSLELEDRAVRHTTLYRLLP